MFPNLDQKEDWITGLVTSFDFDTSPSEQGVQTFSPVRIKKTNKYFHFHETVLILPDKDW